MPACNPGERRPTVRPDSQSAPGPGWASSGVLGKDTSVTPRIDTRGRHPGHVANGLDASGWSALITALPAGRGANTLGSWRSWERA